MKKLIISALTLILSVAACASKGPQQDDLAQQQIRELDATLKAHEQWKKDNARTLNLPPIQQGMTQNGGQYVELGMTFDAVERLCGLADDTHMTQNASGTQMSLLYDWRDEMHRHTNEFINKRIEKGCSGLFVFDRTGRLAEIIE